MVGKLSQLVLDAVYSRLSASNGFNACIATQAITYGLLPNFIQINWSANSQNFYFDQIDSELLEKSGIIQYPFACLFILDAIQTGVQKFQKFSGNIRCIFEVNFSWTSIKGTQNREVYSSCIEDAVVDVMNRTENQDWGKPLVYNGNILCHRGPTTFGAENFRKKLTFSMLFELHGG